MRYPDGHKESVRARIVEAASRALRRDGLDGVSIPKLMKMAGLTHGGFYAHFRDRDELVAEAVLCAANGTSQGIFEAEDRSADDTLSAYLTKGHVNHPEHGCVLAALGPEARRQPAPVRRAFAESARGFLRHVEKKLDPGSTPGKLSDRALSVAASMIGAIVLARLVQDDALAARILAAVRSRATD
jgi:TetR/AcrR family transcriptional repressor of nem operon